MQQGLYKNKNPYSILVHPQLGKVVIDAMIAELVERLWKLGISTIGSDHGKPGSWGFISFHKMTEDGKPAVQLIRESKLFSDGQLVEDHPFFNLNDKIAKRNEKTIAQDPTKVFVVGGRDVLALVTSHEEILRWHTTHVTCERRIYLGHSLGHLY